MAEYRNNEAYNSFENELREAFSIARDQLNQEEVRIINLYRNMPKRAYHRTCKKDAIIEQLTEICQDIDYKLVSPKLSSIKTNAIKYFNTAIKQSLEEQDIAILESEVNSIVSDQLIEFSEELQKSRKTLDNIMYGSFLSDESNSIVQKMHGLKSKLADSIKGRSIGDSPGQLLIPNRNYASEINPYITDAKRTKTETNTGQSFPKPIESIHTELEPRSLVPQPKPLIPELTIPLLTPTMPVLEPKSPIVEHECPEPIEPPKPKVILEPILAKGKAPDYKSKGKPIESAGKFGLNVGEFKLPKGIAFDSVDARIFIAESSNAGSRIQIYSIKEKSFSVMKQEFLKKPHGIAVLENSIFITDLELNAIVEFTIDTFDYMTHNGGLGERDGQLNTPNGLCVAKNLDVYVADNKNSRISVFKKELKFKEHIGVGILFEPKDVKLTKETVVVLDTCETCLHFFSRKSGDLIRSCITMGKGLDVYRPMFFFIDAHFNILISDQFGHSVHIFDQEGHKIHTIGGTSGHGEGQLFSPTGLFVNNTGEIVVISCNKNNILQNF